MTCVICKHGRVEPGHAVVTLQRGDSIVVIKGVPADVCATCGEYYLAAGVADEVLQRAEAAVRDGVEVAVQRYAA